MTILRENSIVLQNYSLFTKSLLRFCKNTYYFSKIKGKQSILVVSINKVISQSQVILQNTIYKIISFRT